jgi:hypothetical protein
MSKDRWRNGSASDSRSEGYPFKSGVVHVTFCHLKHRKGGGKVFLVF